MKKLKKCCTVLTIAILTLTIMFMAGCESVDETSACKICTTNDFTANSVEKILDNREWCLVRTAENDYEQLSSAINIEEFITQQEFEEAVGVYVYREENNLYCIPVYAECIDGSNGKLKQVEIEELYLVDNIKPAKMEKSEKAAYHIIYERGKSEKFDVVGTLLLKSSISKLGNHSVTKDGGTYDTLNGVFEFYPEKGITLQKYEVSLTVNEKEGTYRIPEWYEAAYDTDTTQEGFVEHVIRTETLDNGFFWRGIDVNGEYNQPAKVTPWIIVFSEKGRSKEQKYSLTLENIELKGVTREADDAIKGISLDCSFLNHGFVKERD